MGARSSVQSVKSVVCFDFINCRPNNRWIMQKLIAAALSFIVIAAASALQAQAPPGANESPARPTPKLGVLVNEPIALQGYTLVAPLQSTKTYLIDMQGRVVRTWESR